MLYTAPFMVDTHDRAAIGRPSRRLRPIRRSPRRRTSFSMTSSDQTINTNNPASNPFGLAYPGIWQANCCGRLQHGPARSSPSGTTTTRPITDFGIREALMSIPTMSIVMAAQRSVECIDGHLSERHEPGRRVAAGRLDRVDRSRYRRAVSVQRRRADARRRQPRQRADEEALVPAGVQSANSTAPGGSTFRCSRTPISRTSTRSC